ncbi:MAG TPA: hypothetical protein PK728_08160 [Bacillota bacterium]|nr:hypothetical protein [Bacillota bacterium]
MDQIYQLQRQIQDLRQEVNNISQVANQLQRSEANNAAQLQRLQQNEVLASQQLQQIQHLCNRLSQDVNIISNVAQQVTSQMLRPYTSGQFGMTQPLSQQATGQFGTAGFGFGTSQYTPAQFSAFGTQAAANRTMNMMAAVDPYTSSFSIPAYSNIAGQSAYTARNIPSTFGMSTMGAQQSALTGTSAPWLQQHFSPAQNYGTFGFAGQYTPSFSTMGATSQIGSGLFGGQPALSSMPLYSS